MIILLENAKPAFVVMRNWFEKRAADLNRSTAKNESVKLYLLRNYQSD